MATSKKIVLLRGVGELGKLESTGAAQTFKYVVEQCKLVLGPRRAMVMQVRDDTLPTTIVKGTTHYVAICQLHPGEEAPNYLPRVSWAYL